MKYRWLIILIFIINTIFAQNEANVWYFGNNAGLDFNSGAPVALTDGQMMTQEGCASIADANGNLQLYTDGTTVWNRDHTIMVNGTGLNGNFSSTQSAIIVPKPGDANIYFIFTVDFQGGVNGLQYSEVDITLDGGLGAITANKNILLTTPVLEKLTAVEHANGTDIWVICRKNGSAEFYAYLVTNTGIQNTPVITDIGFTYSGVFFDENAGYMKSSPDGSKLAMAFVKFTNGLQLFDFDTSTGQFSNHRNFIEAPGAVQPYGLEFSPSGDILYASGSGGIGQYDLTLPTPFDIQLNTTFLSSSIADNSWLAMQLAPDGKIYITRRAINGAPDIHALSVINNPDVLGLGCDFQLDTIPLGSGVAQSGLPPFIQSFFNVGFEFENLCLGDATQFDANISQAYDSLVWDFGDTNTSTLENPTHTFTSSGTYNVTLAVTVGGQTTTDTREVTIYEQPVAHPIPDQVACDDDGDGFYFYDLTIHALDVLNGQDPNLFTLTYYDGIANYNNGIPIDDETQFENLTLSSADPVISISNSNNPECEDVVVIHIDFLEGANPSQNVNGLSECDNTSFGTDTDGIILFDLTQNETAILNGQSTADFIVNYFTDASLTNQITNPSAYQNTNANETIYVQMVNNTSSICNGITSFTIEVLELPIVASSTELRQCDDDLDGFSIFNLTEVNAELSVNYQNETITFYESQTDAENELNVIVNETTYINQTVSVDMVWARVENSIGCYKTAQVDLIVSTTQIPTTYTRDFYACDDGVSTTDGVSTFNLSSVNAEIEALFPVGQQLIINYYRNQADALSEVDPIIDITNYQNVGYPNLQDVFIRVDSALDNDCLGLGHHITLHVETVPIANAVIVNEQCDDDGDGMYAFDTSTIETTLLNGQTDVTVSYFDEIGNPLSSPLPNPFNTNSQTVTARVINAISQDPDGACFDETEIVFTVDAAAVANPVPDFIACDDNSDGQFSFDTSTIEAAVLNGQTGMVVTYFDEAGNPLSSPLPNPFITASQSVTVHVENALSVNCFDETVINFIVNEQPIANNIENDFVCDDITNDGEHVFILSNYDSEILNGQSTTTFEVLYFETDSDAQNMMNALPNMYVLNSSSQTIYVRIQNTNNTDCFDITSFEIGLQYLPIANQPQDISVCDDSTNDGIETFNLSIQNPDILNGQSATDNVISYHESVSDAENNINPLGDSFTNAENPQTIYVRLENSNSTDCYTTTSFQFIVNEQPVLLMDDQWPICEGDSVEIIADEGYDEYLWSTGETTQSIVVDTSGTYEVIATNVYGDLRCEASKTVVVTQSNSAIITDIEIEDWSQTNNSITILVEGTGDYEYSIDGFIYQDSNIFSGLTVDEYTVYVRDKNGCGIVTEDIYLLYYPRFFTPNGDGKNDSWQIINSNKEPNNIIYIYDRYGKLLKQISPLSSGWNGTINGQRLPSNDYWFVLERQNGKQYTGHFALKR